VVPAARRVPQRHGRDQATAAARALADEPLTTVYASTALRAEQTARLLAGPAADVVATPGLAEVGIGRHEGSVDP
jgi:broad specificity phosphatase PhoE